MEIATTQTTPTEPMSKGLRGYLENLAETINIDVSITSLPQIPLDLRDIDVGPRTLGKVSGRRGEPTSNAAAIGYNYTFQHRFVL